MTDQQTIDWLQARLTSAEDLTLSQTRFMAQMTIKMSNLEAENERLRELVEEAYEEGYRDCADKADYTWVTSIALRNLQPKRGK